MKAHQTRSTDRRNAVARPSIMLAVFAWVLAGPSVAHGVLSFTPQAGGGGGTLFTKTCGFGFYLNGIQGRSGTLVDRVNAVCARQSTIGEVVATNFLSSNGGSGGTAFDLRCPRGWAVTGLQGRAASVVDRIQLICAPVETDGTVLLAAERVDQFKAGGTGGTSFSLHCAGDRPARSIRGKAGSLIDSIGLGCEDTGLAPRFPTSTTQPDLYVVVRDLPFRVRRGDSVEYTTALWNIGNVPAPAAEINLITNFPISFPSIDFGFQNSCDFQNLPSIPGHFIQCSTSNATAPLATRMQIVVTFTADGQPGNYTFGGQADADFLITEARENNNVALNTLVVVDSGISGVWEEVAQHCQHEAQDLACKVNGTIIVENPGTGSTDVHSAVAFYLSSDELWDEDDTFLTTANVGVVQDGAHKQIHFEAKLAKGVDPSGQFVIAVLDVFNAVDERNEDNNVVASPPIP